MNYHRDCLPFLEPLPTTYSKSKSPPLPASIVLAVMASATPTIINHIVLVWHLWSTLFFYLLSLLQWPLLSPPTAKSLITLSLVNLHTFLVTSLTHFKMLLMLTKKCLMKQLLPLLIVWMPKRPNLLPILTRGWGGFNVLGIRRMGSGNCYFIKNISVNIKIKLKSSPNTSKSRNDNQNKVGICNP